MKNQHAKSLRDDGPRRREKALADALAGVAASLVSLWLFYPLEVLKINTQAAAVLTSCRYIERGNNNPPLSTVVHQWKCQRLWAGIRLKSVATASSSFCYFFLYSWILSLYHQRRLRCSSSLAHSSIPAGTRLGLAAVAAILNTLITLPLDVLSTRQQATTTTTTVVVNDEDDELEEEENVKTNHSNGKNNDAMDAVESLCDSDEFSDIDDKCLARSNYAYCRSTTEDLAVLLRTTSWLCRRPSELLWKQLYPWKILWRGLVPSLLLCSNPAINYTVFDVVKGWILRRQSLRNNAENTNSRHLTLMESFWIGLLAKFVSTIVTYPLIRSKVKIMVQEDSDDSCTNNNSCTSLWVSLCHEFRHHGVAGLYQGCHLQLFHTLLKSALLMMLRERIEETTRRWLVSASPSEENGSSTTNYT